MEPNQEISLADIYLGPSITTTFITKDGLIFDAAPEKIIGLWDPSTGRCVKVHHKLLTKIDSFFYTTLLLHDSERVLIITDASFYVFSLNDENLIKQIRTNTRFDRVILHNDENKIVGITSGFLQVWDLEGGVMTKKLYIGIESKGKGIKRLESGPYLIYSDTQDNLDAELYLVDPEITEVKKIQNHGCIYSIASSKSNVYAIGKSKLIKVYDNSDNNALSNYGLKGFEEIYLSLVFIPGAETERLVSGSNKGTIRIWDFKLGKCIKTFGGGKDDINVNINLLLYVPGKPFLLSSMCEKRMIKVWEIDQSGDDMKPLRTLVGDITKVDKVLVLEKKYLGILCFAQYHEKHSVYLQEIRVVSLETGQVLAKKQEENFRLIEANSMMSVYDSRILYLAKAYASENQNHVLHIWDYRMNYENTYDFSVDNPNGAIFYKFNRILVPYCLSIAGKDIYMKGPSGISVYDFSVKQIWKKDFEYDIVNKAMEMIDESHIAFINQKNQMEIWNIKTKEPPTILETSPNIFTKIKFSNKFYFLTSSKEFIIWENNYFECVHKRKRPEGRFIVQVEFVKGNIVLILFSDGTLEKADLDNLLFTTSKIEFRAKNFVIFNENNIFVSGDAIIKKINLIDNF